MDLDTKQALYFILDLIDNVSSLDFVNIDLEKVNLIRKEVLDIINSNSNKDENISDEKIKLVGILPSILLDKNKFSTNKDVLYFAEKCLKIEVKDYWYTRKREEVLGRIIAEVSKKNEKELKFFMDAWNSFNKNTNILTQENSYLKTKKKNKETSKKDLFLDTWFKFFDDYKKEEYYD